jgi:hypothetical protein
VTHSEKDAGDAAHPRTADADEVNGAQVVWNGLCEIWLDHGYQLKTRREASVSPSTRQ